MQTLSVSCAADGGGQQFLVCALVSVRALALPIRGAPAKLTALADVVRVRRLIGMPGPPAADPLDHRHAKITGKHGENAPLGRPTTGWESNAHGCETSAGRLQGIALQAALTSGASEHFQDLLVELNSGIEVGRVGQISGQVWLHSARIRLTSPKFGQNTQTASAQFRPRSQNAGRIRAELGRSREHVFCGALAELWHFL